MDKILPCPWCSHSYPDVYECVRPEVAQVRCIGCEASGPKCHTTEEAIGEWNRIAAVFLENDNVQ